ncbi:hypothetical protein GIB67_003610 [Kingdonia uniflora]|uniref:Pentatricopeptide repeat-containing protein n=1 Tax=Kingdonia uniflora TaxID=39325 RepID=A0A7J7MF52_9MAGN|nr:hypothetical protein GIB67_003610 [Kingdonia uniflora]
MARSLLHLGKLDFGFVFIGTVLRNGCDEPQWPEMPYDRKRFEQASHLFNKIKQNGYACDDVTYETIVDTLCKTASVEKALISFPNINLDKRSNPLMYNAIINGLCKNKQILRAHYFCKYIEGKDIDIIMLNIVVDARCKDGMIKEAQTLFEVMPKNGVQPNVVTYNALIDGLCNSGKWEEATELFNQMSSSGILPNPDVIVYALMNEFDLQSQMDEANGGLKVDIRKHAVFKNMCKSINLDMPKKLDTDVICDELVT